MNCRAIFLLVLGAPAWAAPAFGQTCPEALDGARRLVLVTAETMTTFVATAQLFERTDATTSWRSLGAAEPVLLGRAGMAWGHGFHHLRKGGEPTKVEGDKRTPAGVYRLGQSFGFTPSPQAGYIHVTKDTVCVDDPASAAYNTITSRAVIGSRVHAETMYTNPRYRRGLVVNYPMNAATQAGSCIFIHIQRSPTSPTLGCVALPEARVAALQAFAEPGAVLAVLPKAAFDRLSDCLPQVADSKP
jgi:L,D-peptidoglycan transpeptidase YkuD (ErfK/YbiS/YcfS/YnhG family)